jgi:hypothetical protein
VTAARDTLAYAPHIYFHVAGADINHTDTISTLACIGNELVGARSGEGRLDQERATIGQGFADSRYRSAPGGNGRQSLVLSDRVWIDDVSSTATNKCR